MGKPRVIVTRRWPAAVEEALSARFDTQLNADDHAFSREELAAALRGADALCPTVTDVLGADLFGSGASVRIIGNYGVGYNQIDVDAAREHGIVVTNTPDVLTDCTADLAMTLILMCARRRAKASGNCAPATGPAGGPAHGGSACDGQDARHRGHGTDRRATARRARRGFGMRIACFSRSRCRGPCSMRSGRTRLPTSMNSLQASTSSPCTVPHPGNPSPDRLSRLALMRRTAFLINGSRGPLVDEQALADALAAAAGRGGP